MKNMRKWMLGAAVMTGVLGLGAGTAKAAEFGIYVRGPVAYVPPCPGPGYAWAGGYYTDGYWVPGRWAFVGARDYDRDRYYRHDNGRRWDRDRGWDRGRDRRWDYDDDRFRGYDHEHR